MGLFGKVSGLIRCCGILAKEFSAMSTEQYDPLSDAQITALAQRVITEYPREYQGRITLLCRSENATFKVTTDRARYALRLHRPDYHSRAAIVSELAWLDALNDAGIQVPQAIPAEDGDRVRTLCMDDGGERYAVLFHWIEGEMPATDVDPRAFSQLGEINARLHQHARQWARPEGFERIVWNHQTMVGSQGHWGCWRDAPGLKTTDQPIIDAALKRVAQALEVYGHSPERYGLIHADLRLTNLLLQDGETRVIDFDDCGLGWYMHDLAAAISFNEHLRSAPQWVEQWLNGYEKVAHLDQTDLAMIPALIIQRRVQMMAWTGTHAQTEMTLSLGADWADESVRLCQAWLERDAMPLGKAC